MGDESARPLVSDPRFPIGRFAAPDPITEEHIAEWTADLGRLPLDLRRAVTPLSESQRDTPYRPGGWTVRQIVHHLSDTHLNSFLRFRWALTEDAPVVKPFDVGKVAELPDYQAPVEHSLDLLEALHARWVGVLAGVRFAELQRSFRSPEGNVTTLAKNLGIYTWHGRHHLAHIQNAPI